MVCFPAAFDDTAMRLITLYTSMTSAKKIRIIHNKVLLILTMQMIIVTNIIVVLLEIILNKVIGNVHKHTED